MENQSSDHNGRENNGECRETVKIMTVQEFSRLFESQSRKLQPDHAGGAVKIRKVPPQLRMKKNGHVYNPMMVSLGPYHHGKAELQQAEEFKYHCLDWCANGNEEKKVFFYNKILEEIDVIRDCYAEAMIVKRYDDKLTMH